MVMHGAAGMFVACRGDTAGGQQRCYHCGCQLLSYNAAEFSAYMWLYASSGVCGMTSIVRAWRQACIVSQGKALLLASLLHLTSVGLVVTFTISSVWHILALSSAVAGICVAILPTDWVKDGRTETALITCTCAE